jgi:hypothetical protein
MLLPGTAGHPARESAASPAMLFATFELVSFYIRD